MLKLLVCRLLTPAAFEQVKEPTAVFQVRSISAAQRQPISVLVILASITRIHACSVFARHAAWSARRIGVIQC